MKSALSDEFQPLTLENIPDTFQFLPSTKKNIFIKTASLYFISYKA